ncbi:MAG: bacillithiol system redox-active protein YtxJ [Saprospiraceae bacterium]|jgi:bacillithiol system protein YtxJ|nr:bacillithiol system redox-active protein YtxJ [Saprospiraceae bacterium]
METFPWNELRSDEELVKLSEESFDFPVMIFKHSTRCNISSIAKYRIESDACSLDKSVKFYYLDLIAHRHISSKISELFNVHHESPQILVIKNGDCILDSSHLDIQIDEVKEVLSI